MLSQDFIPLLNCGKHYVNKQPSQVFWKIRSLKIFVMQLFTKLKKPFSHSEERLGHLALHPSGIVFTNTNHLLARLLKASSSRVV